MPLKLSEILAAEDRKLAVVPCPEWGGDVVIRALSGTQRDELDFWQQEHAKSGRAPVHFRAKVVALSLCEDDKGTPATVTEADILKLSEKSGTVLDLVFDRCCELSCLFGRLKDDALKNSDGQNTASG